MSEQHILEMTYKNWKGVISQRRIAPISIRIGVTEWHTEPGVLLLARDIEKGALREFALKDCDFLNSDFPLSGISDFSS